MKRSKKATGSDAIEQLQSVVIEMLARENSNDIKRFTRYLDSTKSTVADCALILTALYSKLNYTDDLELNALFQEAFRLCGQAVNDYKSINDRLTSLGV